MFKYGKEHHSWKGGVVEHGDGYLSQRCPNHNRASNGYVLQHILVAEEATGIEIPIGAIVHHVNGDKSDNRKCNLVICQDDAFHQLLHRRKRALEACGNPTFRMCQFCKKWDEIGNLYVNPKNNSVWHRECINKYHRERYRIKKEAKN